MAIELSFWKYKLGEYLDNGEVYQSCCQGLSADELEELDEEAILSALRNEFSGWECRKEGDELIFDGGGKGHFNLFSTGQFMRMDCFEMDYEDMNTIVDVMHEFACPLYDPSLPQRFDTYIEI